MISAQLGVKIGVEILLVTKTGISKYKKRDWFGYRLCLCLPIIMYPVVVYTPDWRHSQALSCLKNTRTLTFFQFKTLNSRINAGGQRDRDFFQLSFVRSRLKF